MLIKLLCHRAAHPRRPGLVFPDFLSQMHHIRGTTLPTIPVPRSCGNEKVAGSFCPPHQPQDTAPGRLPGLSDKTEHCFLLPSEHSGHNANRIGLTWERGMASSLPTPKLWPCCLLCDYGLACTQPRHLKQLLFPASVILLHFSVHPSTLLSP